MNWFLHSTFYFIVVCVVGGTLETASTWNSDPEAADAIWGFAILIVVALILRAVALSRDTPPTTADMSRPSRVFPTICFVYSLFMFGAFVYGSGTAFDKDFDLKEVLTFLAHADDVLWVLLVVMLFSITSLGWRQSIPRQAINAARPRTSRIRRFFLVYRPTYPLGWFVRVLAICALISTGMSVRAFFSTNLAYVDSDDIVFNAIFVPLMGALSILSAHRWATHLERRTNLGAKTQTAVLSGKFIHQSEPVNAESIQ